MTDVNNTIEYAHMSHEPNDAALLDGIFGKELSKNWITKVSIIIPGNTIRTPPATFSSPESLNFLKVIADIKANTGITAKYKIPRITGDSVIKKYWPAIRKAKVAKNQIKNPMPSIGRINCLFDLFIMEILAKVIFTFLRSISIVFISNVISQIFLLLFSNSF